LLLMSVKYYEHDYYEHEQDNRRTSFRLLTFGTCFLPNTNQADSFHCSSEPEPVRLMLQEKYSNAFLGFGPEDKDYFALELTYNYGVDSYDLGEGFGHFGLAVPDVYKTVESIKAGGEGPCEQCIAMLCHVLPGHAKASCLVVSARRLRGICVEKIASWAQISAPYFKDLSPSRTAGQPSKMVPTGAFGSPGGKIRRDAGPVKGGKTVIAFVDDPTGYQWELIGRPAEKIRDPIAQVAIRKTDSNHAKSQSFIAAGPTLPSVTGHAVVISRHPETVTYHTDCT
jgi:hypothetical protein